MGEPTCAASRGYSAVSEVPNVSDACLDGKVRTYVVAGRGGDVPPSEVRGEAKGSLVYYLGYSRLAWLPTGKRCARRCKVLRQMWLALAQAWAGLAQMRSRLYGDDRCGQVLCRCGQMRLGRSVVRRCGTSTGVRTGVSGRCLAKPSRRAAREAAASSRSRWHRAPTERRLFPA